MKKIISLILSVVIIVSIFVSCGKKEEANASVSDTDISINVNLFECSPHNTFIDCDDEYIYFAISKHDNISGGIYKMRRSGGAIELIYKNDDTPLLYGDREYIPYISAISLYKDYIFFHRYNVIYRINKDGSDLLEIANVEKTERLFVMNDMLYIKVGVNYYVIDLMTSEYNVAINNEPFSDFFPKDYMDSFNIADYEFNENVIIDYKNHSIYFYQQATGVTHNNLITVKYTFYEYDLNCNFINEYYIYDPILDYDNKPVQNDSKASDVNLTHIKWFNAEDGLIYGYKQGNIYVFNLQSNELHTIDVSEYPSISGFIDVVDGTLYFKSGNSIYRCDVNSNVIEKLI